MNYANANALTNGNCYHCGKNQQTHAFNIIKSTADTDNLAKSFQAKLDQVYATALTKGYSLPADVTMAGAMIATVGSVVIKAVALSGGNANRIIGLVQGGMGKDVAIIGDNVPLQNFKSLINMSLTKWATNVDQRRAPGAAAAAVNPPIAVAIAQPNFMVGSCAAQKLLNNVVQYAVTNSKKISAITMSEIFWKANGIKSNWSSGETVPSCNTCNYVLPMMLCNYDNDDNKVPYP